MRGRRAWKRMDMLDDRWRDKRMTSFMIYLDYASLHRRLVSEVNESERTLPLTPKSAR